MTPDPAILERLEVKLDLLIEKSAQPPQRWLSVKSSASYSGLSVESIRRMLSAGKLTACRPIRGRVVIDKNEIDSVISTATKIPRKGRGIT